MILLNEIDLRLYALTLQFGEIIFFISMIFHWTAWKNKCGWVGAIQNLGEVQGIKKIKSMPQKELGSGYLRDC